MNKPIDHWLQLLPDIQEAYDLRNMTDCGLAEAKMQLLRQNIDNALMYLDPNTMTPVEKTIVACLIAALHEGMI